MGVARTARLLPVISGATTGPGAQGRPGPQRRQRAVGHPRRSTGAWRAASRGGRRRPVGRAPCRRQRVGCPRRENRRAEPRRWSLEGHADSVMAAQMLHAQSGERLVAGQPVGKGPAALVDQHRHEGVEGLAAGAAEPGDLPLGDGSRLDLVGHVSAAALRRSRDPHLAASVPPTPPSRRGRTRRRRPAVGAPRPGVRRSRRPPAGP